MALHMIKLCVGCDTVEELVDWWRARGSGDGIETVNRRAWTLRTRQTPKRAAEMVDGGSLYRVFKGFVLCRQRILAVDTVGTGPASHCEVSLDPQIVLTAPMPRRPFQGWRYLEAKDAPADLQAFGEEAVPQHLAKQLRELGAW